jgi:hypothetical protein
VPLLLLKAHACSFTIVVCTNAILCLEVFYVTLFCKPFYVWTQCHFFYEWYYGCLARPWLLGLWVGSNFLIFIHSPWDSLHLGSASYQSIKTVPLKVTGTGLPSSSSSLFSVYLPWL